MSVLEWLTSKILPEAVKTGSLGSNGTKFVSFEVSDEKGIDHVLSDVIFGDIVLESAESRRFNVPVVVKTRRHSMDQYMDGSSLFHNEVLFYTEILPLLRKYDRDNLLSASFCEFVYGQATNDQKSTEDVIILKHLGQKDFRLSEDRLYPDRKHVELVLDRIGKFHALSLLCQADDPRAFEDIASKVKNIVYTDECDKQFWATAFLRGVEALEVEPEYQDRLTDLIGHCKGGRDQMEKYSSDRSGPLTVIAHGDFTRNNMMFKYGPDGAPIEVAFFDFGTIKYCSPAIDTSSFLFCNVSTEMRRDHWEHFIRTYHDAVLQMMAKRPHAPSFETVNQDLRRSGISGYHQCSLYVPMMVHKIKGIPQPYEANSTVHVEAIKHMQEVIKHMLDRDYIF
nr:PREDICTED: uncharacterized protein LOC109041856 isoform X2 [Bemisia tabaci]XP_018913891.1 PREDICTED: uncharacterized protein LOC109041856 isoform X2 [Bemisia tabaci]